MKKALLLHYGGEREFEFFKTLDSNVRVLTPATATTAAVNETINDAALCVLNNHFIPRVNTECSLLAKHDN